MIHLRTRLLIVWLLTVTAATLGPFDFTARPAELNNGFTLYRPGSDQHHPIHFLLNVLLFAPLGALLYYEGRHRCVRLRSSILAAGVTGLLISLTAESLQHFLPGRESSIIDVAANTTGALSGVFGTCEWGESLAAGLNRVRRFILQH